MGARVTGLTKSVSASLLPSRARRGEPRDRVELRGPHAVLPFRDELTESMRDEGRLVKIGIICSG
jgi:hypothetical protein